MNDWTHEEALAWLAEKGFKKTQREPDPENPFLHKLQTFDLPLMDAPHTKVTLIFVSGYLGDGVPAANFHAILERKLIEGEGAFSEKAQFPGVWAASKAEAEAFMGMLAACCPYASRLRAA